MSLKKKWTYLNYRQAVINLDDVILTTTTEISEGRFVYIQITFWSLRYYENITYNRILSI